MGDEFVSGYALSSMGAYGTRLTSGGAVRRTMLMHTSQVVHTALTPDSDRGSIVNRTMEHRCGLLMLIG